MTFPSTNEQKLALAANRAAQYRKTSNKYHSYSTESLVSIATNTLTAAGYSIESFINLKTYRKNAKSSAHRVDLRINIGDEEIVPRLIIDNSFNGEGSLMIRFGIYRLVCSNGLIAGKDIIEPVVMRHLAGEKANAFEQRFADTILVACKSAIDAALRMREKLKQIPMPLSKKDSFYSHLQSIGFITETRRLQLTRNRMPVRQADSDGTSWGLFNHVQESLITQRNGKRAETAAAVKRNDELADIFNEFVQMAA